MKKKIFEVYSTLFWIFLIGSFIGFLNETLLTIIKGNFALRKGLIYEPLIPIYGIGAIIFYMFYNNINIKKEKIYIYLFKIFLLGFFIGGMVEYMSSFFQEEIFGTISWNYSKLIFNLNGRTSLFHCIFWGILSIIFCLTLLPLMNKFKKYLCCNFVKIFTVVLSIIFIFDCVISCLACNRQTERRNSLKATNKIDNILDKKYPDNYLNEIYNNAKTIKK